MSWWGKNLEKTIFQKLNSTMILTLITREVKKKCITKDEAFLLLYVDDEASLFNSRNDAIVGTNEKNGP